MTCMLQQQVLQRLLLLSVLRMRCGKKGPAFLKAFFSTGNKWAASPRLRAGDLETVKEMLAAGASDRRLSDLAIKQHPLTVAAQCNQRAVVETLLSRSASIIIVSNGRIGTLAKVVYEGRLRMASYLLAHITTQPFVRRIASVNYVGSRRECTPGECTREEEVACLLNIQSTHLRTPILAMLVADGHLQATEPTGWAGLANRLAGKPSKWLGGHLTLLGDAVRMVRIPSSRSDVARCRKMVIEQTELCLAFGARPRWSCEAHSAYPADFREQVRTILLCANRLEIEFVRQSTEGGELEIIEDEPALLGKLPKEC